MRFNHFYPIVMIMLVLIVNCTPKEGDIAKVRKEIASANENFMTAFRQGNAAALAALYTENARILPPNSDFVTGKEAIQKFWQALIDMGIKEVDLKITELESFRDTAIEVSKYTLKGAAGQILDRGKYIVIWKKENGKWKLHRDIFNSSLPVQKEG